MSVTGLAAAGVRATFTARARREVLFCVLVLPLSLPLPFIGFIGTIGLGAGNSSWRIVLTAIAVAAVVTVLLVATGAARALAGACRRLAGSLLGEQVAGPPPRMGARLTDGPGWRAMAYLMLRLPDGLLEGYAVAVFWGAGLVNLTYPFWWLSFRNHPPGVRLSPVDVITPVDWIGQGHFQVTTFPGTFA